MVFRLAMAPQALAEYVALSSGVWARIRGFADQAWDFAQDNFFMVVALVAGLAVLLAILSPRVR